jgi:hypothetical protein
MELIDGSAKILAQAFFRAREFAQPDDIGMVRGDTPKTMLVGPQRIRSHVGIAAVVLRSGHRMSIPKPIQLMGLIEKTANPPSKKASTTGPRGTSIAIAILAGWPFARLLRLRKNSVMAWPV